MVKVETLIPSEAEVSLAAVYCCHLLVDYILNPHLWPNTP